LQAELLDVREGFCANLGKAEQHGVTFDLGQADVVRLGNGTLLLPESHRPVLGSPGRDVCGWIMVDSSEGDFGVGWCAGL
jgi:hypothetical protein